MSITFGNSNNDLLNDIKFINNIEDMRFFISNSNELLSYMNRKKFIFQLYKENNVDLFLLFTLSLKEPNNSFFCFKKIFENEDEKYIKKIMNHEKLSAIIEESQDEILLILYKKYKLKNNIKEF